MGEGVEMTNADFLSALNLVVTVALAVWAIYQTRLTQRLEGELQRLNMERDQNIQRLYRAGDVLTDFVKARACLLAYFDYHYNHNFPLDPKEASTQYAYMKSSYAELNGLAASIRDNKLSVLVSELEEKIDLIVSSELEWYEAHNVTQSTVMSLHERISELIAEATKETK